MKIEYIRINVLLVLAALVFSAGAQGTQQAEPKEVHPGILERTGFLDNWYLEAGGGVNMLFSDDAGRLDFGDRLTPLVNLTLGKWFAPTWGLRLQAGGWSLHSYNGIKGNYIGNPLPGMGGAFGSDDPARDFMEIYPDGTYRQNLRYANIHADFQFSLANLIGGFNPDRRWDAIPSVGIGYTRIIPHKGTPGANVLSTHFGIMGKFRIIDCLDINLEASTSLMPDRFDGRISSVKPYAETFGVTLGLTWRFGKSKFKPLKCDYYNQLQQTERILADTRRESDEWKAKAETQPKEVVREVVKEVPVRNNFVLCSVQFKSDNYTVCEREHGAALTNVANFLKNSEDGIAVLKGYADKQTGYAEYNQKMADNRVKSVADYLVDSCGVSRDRLRVESYGDTEQPYDTSVWNRAVVIEITYP